MTPTRSVVTLRMRNGTSKSPFRPRLSRQPVMPRPPCGQCWTRQKTPSPTSPTNGLTACRMSLQIFSAGYGKHTPSPLRKSARTLPLPRTTGLRFALPSRQRRLETLREANDLITNTIAEMPIFREYDIGGLVHSSSDGQKFETGLSTINARYSPKYFGLKKGIVAYTLVANHIQPCPI